MISTPRTPGEPLKPKAPWSAIKLKLARRRDSLCRTPASCSSSVRSAAAASSFRPCSCRERDLINWRSGFESLFNACLLRRPPRKYRQGYFGDVTLAWADDELEGPPARRALNTNLRYFARDLGVDTAYRFEEVDDEAITYPQFNQPRPADQVCENIGRREHAGGIGAWNDFSATADAARTALREAAGVEVPGSDFVVLCLAAYLVALVPLNWLIFHTIGRVEWAWIAAPVIAIVGTLVIVQRAQLDIGFVRAQTEIGLLEQQPDHPRAHLSRYTALYTSLSTTYDLEFAQPDDAGRAVPRRHQTSSCSPAKA